MHPVRAFPAILFVVMVLFWNASLAADGLALLKNDHSARAAGMGAAFVSIGGDPNATVYNPATAATVNKFTASFGHTFFWEDIRLESGYVASNLASKLYIHGGIRFAAVDDIEARDRPSSEPLSVFDAHDASFKAGLAYRFSERISAGIGAGWFLEKIEGWRGWAFNVDLGVLVVPMENLNVGASITNIGSDFRLEKTGVIGSRDIPLPTTYRFGGSYRYEYLLGAADIVILDEEFHLHTGVEANPHEIFMLRAGYMFNYDAKNFTAGASFTQRNMRVDYAFVPFTQNLGSSHMFNFTFSL
ncbi:MAG: PorV/PorQ family protein [Candidatus Zixiibacteriota bacterium]